MKKKLFAIFLASLMALTVSALSVFAASVPTKATPSKAKPIPTEKTNNAESIFDGYTVTVTDAKTPAKMALGTDWPITTLYFMAENGDHLGSISGTAYQQIMKKYKVIGSDSGIWNAPGANGEWEFWFAEEFNKYRGLSGGRSYTNKSQDGALQGKDDTDVYEVIALTNKERERVGLQSLEAQNALMELAQIRAEEISEKFSHIRPDGVRISELGYGENISKGRSSPSAVVNAWMNSEGHKTNILYTKYQNIGVGCFVKDGTYYWVQLFSWDKNSSNNTSSGKSGSNKVAVTASYSLNAKELSLTAGETYQLSVDSSAYVDNMRIEWSASRLSNGILSVDSNGNITTYYRSGMSSAKATLTVTAKVYVADKLVKSLNCKVIVTQ